MNVINKSGGWHKLSKIKGLYFIADKQRVVVGKINIVCL